MQTEGPRVIEFARQFCRHSTGPKAGMPIEFADFQKDILNELFKLKADGSWQYRQAIIVLPRKCGKTEIGTVLALYALVAKQQIGAQIFAAASAKDQARLCFEPAKFMIEQSPALSQVLEIRRDKIFHKQTGSYFQVLSADAKRQHGLNPYVVIVDETWAHPNGDLTEALKTGMIARPEALLIHITTPGSGEDGYLFDLLQEAKKIKSGEINDPHTLLLWQEPPADIDHTDVEVWRQWHPGFRAGWIQQAALESDLHTTPEAEFRRLYLGQWTAAKEAWLPYGAWASLAEPGLTIEPGERIALAVDGSWANDSTGIVAATPDGRLKVIAHWENTSDPEWRVPLAEVKQAVIDACKQYKVCEVAFDPYWLGAIMQDLEAQGIPVTEFKTNILAQMIPATKRFFDAVMDAEVRHDNDARLARHLNNCRIKTDRFGTRVVKESKNSPLKIDLAICAVVALDRAKQYKEAQRRTLKVY